MHRLALTLVVALSCDWLPAQDALAILERRCIACHNPTRHKSDLDLTERAAALRGGSKGAALRPGDPDGSLALAMVEHRRTPRMPMRQPPLPDVEVAALRTWIAAGAPYTRTLTPPEDTGQAHGNGELQVTDADREFWSFRPFAEAAPPDISAPERAHTEADRFWLASVDAASGTETAEADKGTLLRRLCFTLLGLPPTEAQMAAFAADTRPDAYERVVDALLASPHFGERQARHWLDVARYADSGGYEFDNERPHAYPYRDFVIAALNDDMPFDEFVQLQVAADELQPERPQTWRATGFLCAGPTVGNQETEQTRYDEYDDVVSTIGSAFLGLTLGCARCHDHKYDPIPTRDYYRMVAAFTSTERGDRALLPAADLAAREARRRTRQEEERVLRARRQDLQDAVGARLRRQRIMALDTTDADRALLLAEHDPERSWRYTVSAPAKSFFTEGFDDGAWSDGTAPFGVDFRDLRAATPWHDGEIWMRRQVTWHGSADDLVFGVFHDEDVSIWVNGALAAQAAGHVQEYVLLPATEAGQAAMRPGRNILAVHCRQTTGGQLIDVVPLRRRDVVDGNVRAAVQSKRQRLERQYDAALRVEPPAIRANFTVEERDAVAALERAERSLRTAAGDDDDDVALVMTDRGATPAASYLLRRGNPADKQEPIEPGFLQVLTPAEAQARYYEPRPPKRDSTGRRAALARWLTDVDHGAGRLLARVIVNRVWQHHMGRGLVATPNDFGMQGERPTHPELLDWLAQQLIDGGFRLKAIHRLIVTSTFYRQASNRRDGSAQADDRLGTRRLRMRLDAEALRDAILQTSGSLNPTVFGPSVKPWVHPDAIATGSTSKWPLDVRDGPATWRRSLYVFMRRSVRFPLLEVFDAPDATSSCGRRLPTTTPLQALALLNDGFVRAQAEILAERVRVRAGDDPLAQVRHAYGMALLRQPAADEETRVVAFLAAQRQRHAGDAGLALVDLCQVLFNLNEFLYVD